MKIKEGTLTKAGKIDRRRKYVLMIDTETAGSLARPIFYDIGFAVVDKKGRIYESFSMVNYDVYIKEWRKMDSCFFADKLPIYEEELIGKCRTMSNTRAIRKIILELLEKYNIDTVCGHNMRFDFRAMNNTWHLVGGKGNFLPDYIVYWDTLAMARSVIQDRPTYIRFCEEYGFVTEKTKKPRLTAEALYAYIMYEPDFEEEHTGFEDVLIETVIFAYLMKIHKKMTKVIEVA